MEKLSPRIRIFREAKDVPLPQRKTAGSAGWDVCAAETVDLKPGEVTLVSTGLIVEIPAGYHLRVYMRSGLASREQVTMINAVGIIDSDYCGPDDIIKIPLILHGKKSLRIEKGERIAQFVFARNAFSDIRWDEQDGADFHGENRGGFGSTGRH
jgi:dUTP pyrophosphatase